MTIKDQFTVKPIKRFETHDWFNNKHYAKRIPSISYCYGLYDINKVLQGVISFGSPPSNSLVIGAFNGKYTDIFLELNRLCINDNLEKNVLSFFVSQALKLIEKPKVVVSYADTSQGHNGYIYQATNWIYTGLTEKRTEWRMYNSNKHSKTICEQYTLDERKNDTKKFYTTDRPRKHRYFYLSGTRKQRQEMKDSLTYAVRPYPKGDNKRYDASYAPSIQGLLF